MAMISGFSKNVKQRAWWANALLAFCLYMTIVYLPFDLFFKLEEEIKWQVHDGHVKTEREKGIRPPSALFYIFAEPTDHRHSYGDDQWVQQKCKTTRLVGECPSRVLSLHDHRVPAI